MTIAEQLTIAKADLDAVYEAGKKAGGGGSGEDFLSVFLDNGNRTDFAYGFAGSWWTDKKYNLLDKITVDRCNYMFTQSSITDVSKVTLDFSQKTSASNTTRTFDNPGIVTIGAIDLSNIVGTLGSFFGQSNANDTKLETIQELIVSENLTFGTNFFQNCAKLKNITFAGVIDSNLNMSACPLTAESVQSIIDALAYLTDATTKTLTVHQTVRNAMTEAQVDMIVNTKKWTLAPDATN